MLGEALCRQVRTALGHTQLRREDYIQSEDEVGLVEHMWSTSHMWSQSH